MNANHARPMLAFWVLAIAAAVITSVGVQAGQRPPISVRPVAPSSVTATGNPDLLLGGVLRPNPGVTSSATGQVTSPVIVSPPDTATATGSGHGSSGPRASSQTTGTGHVGTIPTNSSAIAQAHATGIGIGIGKSRKPDQTTTTATATKTPRGHDKTPPTPTRTHAPSPRSTEH